MLTTVQLNSTICGEGPPLLILHGLFGSATNWRDMARQLATDWTVHALDLRNHGQSPWHDDMSYPAMAADVSAYITQQGWASTNVAGHSMGGKVAMQLALHYPEQVQRLMVMDISPVIYQHSHNAYIDALLAVDTARASNRAQIDQALQATIPKTGIRQFLMQNLTASGDGYTWRINLPVLRQAMSDITGFPNNDGAIPYPGSTLFLYGDRSKYVQPEHYPVIRRWFPHAELQEIAGAGHWIHAEQPKSVLKQMQMFFADMAFEHELNCLPA